jgi:competence protein ComFC
MMLRMNGLKRFVQRAAAILFPNRCAFCGSVTVGGLGVCRECEKSLPLITRAVCQNCGREKEFCTCAKRHYEFKRCIAPFYYEGAAKRGVLRLKFYKKQDAAAVFAAYAADAVRREYTDIKFDIVTAVPLAREELKKRGFNQSADFAKWLSKALEIPFRELLTKPYDTKPQRSCHAHERWGNVFGAYAALSAAGGKTVLLADDIATTGATLNECSKMLMLAGADEVYCVVIACVKKA